MGHFHTETPVQNTLGSVPTISARTFPHISYVISFLVNPTCWSFVFPGFVTTSYLLYFFFLFFSMAEYPLKCVFLLLGVWRERERVCLLYHPEVKV